MGTEIQKTETLSPLANAAALVSADGNMDVEKLGKLLEMQERWDATQAKKAYVVAMAEFKEKPPEILKDQTVKYKDVKYNHASLHNVTACTNKALSEHGLTASWVTSQDNGSVKVTCKITHVQGHSEETCLSAPPDATGSKNVIQAIGSTVTYLQRYTLLALTGLATQEQDDDGNGAADKPKIPEPTPLNVKVLDAIAVKAAQEIGDSRIIDIPKMAALFYARKGSYPSKMDKVSDAVAWLVGLGEEEKWTKSFEEKYELVEE